MTQANNTTNPHKGTHLSYKERTAIEVLIHEKYSARKVSIRIHRTRKTIKNEIDRGTITQLNVKSKTARYMIITLKYILLMLVKQFMMKIV